MLAKLMDSPIAWTALAIITVASLVYAIICQQINKEKKEFTYCRKTTSLLHKKKRKFEKLLVSYDGQEIENLCVSRFTIWNSGNKTLYSNDMVTSKELIVTTVEEDRILDVELIVCSEETNKFITQVINEHTVKILFEYADKKDGVVIQIIHTGTAESLKIDCKIKGGKPIKNFINEAAPRLIRKTIKPETFEKIMVVPIIISIILLFGIAIASTIAIFNTDLQNILFNPVANEKQPLDPQNEAIIMSIIFWVCIILICVSYKPIVKLKFGIGIPKSLKKHSDFTD